MSWISVKDRLPDFDVWHVLVATSSGLVDRSFFCKSRESLASLKTSGSYSRKRHGKESGFFEISHRYGYTITHWQPLPEPPSDD